MQNDYENVFIFIFWISDNFKLKYFYFILPKKAFIGNHYNELFVKSINKGIFVCTYVKHVLWHLTIYRQVQSFLEFLFLLLYYLLC